MAPEVSPRNGLGLGLQMTMVCLADDPEIYLPHVLVAHPAKAPKIKPVPRIPT